MAEYITVQELTYLALNLKLPDPSTVEPDQCIEVAIDPTLGDSGWTGDLRPEDPIRIARFRPVYFKRGDQVVTRWTLDRGQVVVLGRMP